MTSTGRCTSCGHLNRPQATWCEMCRKGLTLGSRMAEPWGKTGIASRISTTWALLTGAGCLLLFLLPPLGILLLLISVFTQFYMNKALPGLCPHCNKDTGTIRRQGTPREFPCVHCGKPIVIDESSGKPVFARAPNPFAAGGPAPGENTVDTAWTPIGGASSFRDRELVRVDPGRVEFRSTRENARFYFVFILSGIAVLVGVVFKGIGNFGMDTIWGFLGGLAFVAAGGYPYYRARVPFAFDKRSGIFSKNRRPAGNPLGGRSASTFTRLDEIHAVQLLSKQAGRDRSFTCYELNLVLHSGARINVIAHGATAKLREDAGTLAAFLEKPLWDKT